MNELVAPFVPRSLLRSLFVGCAFPSLIVPFVGQLRPLFVGCALCLLVALFVEI